MMVVFSHISLLFFPYLHNFGNKIIPDDNYIQSFIYHNSLGFFHSGTGAVYIFFLMSGIVLTASMENKNFEGYFKSIICRYPRLMIPAVFSSILMMFAFLFTSSSFNGFHWFSDFYIDTPKFSDALYNGAVKPFFFYGSDYNPVLWTMKTELFGSFMVYFFVFSHK
ncbi:acyltransferase family protein [Photobacterium damselae subsp. damselae]|uniref:acyltransferase family protein n=1 Tax=Photobacterium damselae TaxID=38293 RepID=UPI00311ABEC3